MSLLAACFVLSSCHKDDDDSATDSPRTVVLYMAAQNSLGSGSFLKSDSTEIATAAQYIRPADGRLIVFIDDASLPRLYEVTAEGFQFVKRYDTDLDSADPATLRQVLDDAALLAPAADYGLILWSHATGWLPPSGQKTTATRQRSFGIDVGDGSMSKNRKADGTYGSEMSLSDLAQAVSASSIHHARYIMFDACMMGQLEVAYALRQVADHLVASPIAIDATGANYVSLLQSGVLLRGTADDIARRYVSDYSTRQWGVVQASVRLDRLEALAAATRELLPFTQATGRQSVDMTGVLSYTGYGSGTLYRPYAYDAREAMARLLGRSADDSQPLADAQAEAAWQAWTKALSAAVTYWGSTTTFYVERSAYTGDYCSCGQGSTGLAMFVPQTVYTTNAAKATAYGDLNLAFRQTGWYAAAGWEQTGW